MMIDISKTTFLSADDICTRLSVSRSTFDRWRKISAPPSTLEAGRFQNKVKPTIRTGADAQEDAGLTPFPQATLNVGGSPRWSVEDVNAWLLSNKDKRNRRGLALGCE